MNNKTYKETEWFMEGDGYFYNLAPSFQVSGIYNLLWLVGGSKDSHDVSSQIFRQPNDRSTAIFHRRWRVSRSSRLICGKNFVFSTLTSCSISHSPTAFPANIATPKDVVSAIAGRITSIPIKSDCHCISRLFSVIPPSTCSFSSGIPQSLFMVSSMSRTWKQTASRVARIRWPRCVSNVMPQMTLKKKEKKCNDQLQVKHLKKPARCSLKCWLECKTPMTIIQLKGSQVSTK